ncbi:MAG: HlyD family secretion protein [Proteobacteria bacterium]|nr:HlyD family secretion protein [Pseudomonadota bacterium]MBI3496211.1 HlyD family secretion protein [Pseudomonadota bacterium]
MADLAPTEPKAEGGPPSAGPRPPADQPTTGAPASASGNGKRRRRILVIASILLVLAVGGLGYWFWTRNLVSTDDATIDGDAVRLSPRVAGPVLILNVGDNQPVKKGDLLLEIDPHDYEIAVESAKASVAVGEAQLHIAETNLALTRVTTSATLRQAEGGVALAQATIGQAQAQVAAAEAEAVRAKEDVDRYQRLLRDDFASRQRYEQAVAQTRTADAQLRAAQQQVKVAEAQRIQAEANLDAARIGPQQVAVRQAELHAAAAQLEVARAALDQAELNLSYTRIYAPSDGTLTKRSVREGDVVQKDQGLAALVLNRVWVTANFKETQLARMRAGQPVDIAIDAYPERALKGHVDSIQRGTGAHFSLLPPENATGNFVKVVQRVPVKILFDEELPPGFVAGLGMSVVPTVDVGAKPAQR